MARRRPFLSLSMWPLGGLVLLLAACAQPTPYQPADGGFGYSEQQIEDNRYRVTFAGNSVTPRETVQNYLLYRAAELTVQSGHDYFTIVNQDVEADGRVTASPRVGVGVGGGDVGVGVGLSTILGDGTQARYTAYADVLVFEGEKPEGDETAYDARDVLRRLESEVVRPSA